MIDVSKYIVHKQPVHVKWQAVYNNMSPHILGTPPVELLTARRPIESSDAFALDYRKNNFQPITRQEFQRAIDAYVKCANEVDIRILNINDIADYLSTYRIPANLKNLSLKNFIINFASPQRQLDPNALIVTLPELPNSPLIPRYDAELPNFSRFEARTGKINTITRYIPSQLVHYNSPDQVLFKAGMWVYDADDAQEYKKPYFFELTKEKTILYYPVKNNIANKFGEIEYVRFDYYANNLRAKPAHVVGGKVVMEHSDEGDIVDYYVPDFYGASAWFNQAIAQNSDLQVIETRFTYIEKAVVKEKCNYTGCTLDGTINKYVVFDVEGNKKECPRCQGKGYNVDSTPFNTRLIDNDKGFGEDGKIVPPVMYIEPNTAILKHSADRVDAYYKRGQEALVILQQNKTNQSEGSKLLDLTQKVDMITEIVSSIMQLYQDVLNDIKGFRERVQDIEIVVGDYNIKTAEDLVLELSELKKSGAPYINIVQKTSELLLKQFGSTDLNRKVIDFVSVYDRLFGYGINDLSMLKNIFGDGEINANGLSQRDLVIHNNAFNILMDIASREPNFEAKTFEEIRAIIDPIIDSLLPVAVERDIFE